MSRRPPVCANCRGSRTTHQGDDEGCWCRTCMKRPDGERCTNYVPVTEVQKRPRVSATAPETSRRAAVVAMMREGSLRKSMFHLFQIRGEQGYTDDELEIEMGKSHQSVSACRNGLVADGLVRDSGARRATRYGNEAIVWVVVR